MSKVHASAGGEDARAGELGRGPQDRDVPPAVAPGGAHDVPGGIHSGGQREGVTGRLGQDGGRPVSVHPSERGTRVAESGADDHPDEFTALAGDLDGAASATEGVLADQLRVLGPHHPHTLYTRADLAGWHGQAGDPAGAAAAFQQLLTDRLRVLGPDHPHTLTTRADLAS